MRLNLKEVRPLLNEAEAQFLIMSLAKTRKSALYEHDQRTEARLDMFLNRFAKH